MTAGELREWRGTTLVAAPSGAAIETRIRTSIAENQVIDEVARLLGSRRRADLARVCRPEPMPGDLDDDGRRKERNRRLAGRKKTATAGLSSRWAGTIIRASNDQYRLARDSQYRNIRRLENLVTTITARAAQPTLDTPAGKQNKPARGGKRKHGSKKPPPRGYATQAERYQKLRRLQALQAELSRDRADRDAGIVHVTDGGKRLLRNRNHLEAAGLTLPGWREEWDCFRDRVEANGSCDEPYGNLTITVTPDGTISLRLPAALEHLANSPRGRYVLSGKAVFSHRADEWLARIAGGQAVSYAITRKPGRAGVYLRASWATPAPVPPEAVTGETVIASGPVLGVDLNNGFLSLRRLDEHGNPAGAAERIYFQVTGTGQRRDAQVRHAVTRLIHYARRFGLTTIAVEELGFGDARDTGRETMGRGKRGKQFRRTVAGIPTSVFRNRLAAQTARAGIRLIAVNPAYTSVWGGTHWHKPYKNVTRHEAAATVIGRRAQGHKARRREGVTWVRPEDRTGRAANQAGPEAARAGNDRHPAGMRGTKSRPPNAVRIRSARRATVAPAPRTSYGSSSEPPIDSVGTDSATPDGQP